MANDSNSNRTNVFITIKKGTTGQKEKNNSTEKFFKKRVLFCCFKTKETCLKKTFVLKQSHRADKKGSTS